MGSLKEIKTRILSVKSTRKITSAMKMVSSAKLRKAEKLIQNMLPYEERLELILQDFLHSKEEGIPLIYTRERAVNRQAVLVFASNTSLCGPFNNNVLKKFRDYLQHESAVGKHDTDIYTFGKKISKSLIREHYDIVESFDELADKPDFNQISMLADKLAAMFLSSEVDRVVCIYHQFISKGHQKLVAENFLPVRKPALEEQTEKKNFIHRFYIEPDRDTMRAELLPRFLRIQLYRILLDSNASEHAARMLAMQTATDNADDLLVELTLAYNKTRQQAITAELLDIIGGSFR